MSAQASPRRVAIYARVSTPGQAKRELSVPEQIRAVTAFCKEQGFTVVETYKDEGVSGKGTVLRAGFRKMLAAGLSKSPPFDLVLTRDASRFGRGDEDAFNRSKLRENGVGVDNIESPNGDMFGEMTAGQKFMERVKGAADIAQREEIAPRVIASQKAAVLSGKSMGSIGTVYGYRAVYEGSGPRAVRTVQKDPIRAKFVAKMFKRYAEGDSLHGLATWLFEAGAPAPRGEFWYASSVRRILKNEVVLGKAIYGRVRTLTNSTTGKKSYVANTKPMTVRENAFPALVSQELFDEVQARLLKNPRMLPKAGNALNLVRGLARCNWCGWQIVFQERRSKWYFLCGHFKKMGAAQSLPQCRGTLPGDFIDGAVYDFVKLTFGFKDFEKGIRSAVKAYNARANSVDGTSEVELIHDMIEKKKKELARYVKAVGESDDLAETFMDQIRNVRADILRLEKQSTEVARVLSMIEPLDADEFVRAGEAIKKALAAKNTAKIRALLPSIVSRIEVDFSQRKERTVAASLPFERTTTLYHRQTLKFDNLHGEAEHKPAAVRIVARYDLRMVNEIAAETLERLGEAISA